jgi:hypothetical protein
MVDAELRRATAADLPAIDRLVDEAYRKYVDRIGRRPAPMDADDAAMLGHGECLGVGFRGGFAGRVGDPRDG